MKNLIGKYFGFALLAIGILMIGKVVFACDSSTPHNCELRHVQN